MLVMCAFTSWLCWMSQQQSPESMQYPKQPAITATTRVPQDEAHVSEHNGNDEALAKRVLRKIDWRLIPLMFITYNLNFMDKTILSSASVFSLQEDTVSFPSHSSLLVTG